jgi:hypothetical protein
MDMVTGVEPKDTMEYTVHTTNPPSSVVEQSKKLDEKNVASTALFSSFPNSI